MFFIVIPVSFNIVNRAKIPVYYFKSGVKSIEVKDCNVSLNQNNGKSVIEVMMKLKSYNMNEGFKVGITIGDDDEKSYIEFPKIYNIRKGGELIINQEVLLKSHGDNTSEYYYNLLYSQNLAGTYRIEFTDKEQQSIIRWTEIW